MTRDSFTGPIDFAVFLISRDTDVTAAIEQLMAQTRAGTTCLLDIEVLALDDDGWAVRQPLQILNLANPDLISELEGLETDLLDDDDLADLAGELTEDQFAIVLVYEDRSLAIFANHLFARGGQLAWVGGVHTEEIDQALELTKES